VKEVKQAAQYRMIELDRETGIALEFLRQMKALLHIKAV